MILAENSLAYSHARHIHQVQMNYCIIQPTKHRYENHVLVKRRQVPHEIQYQNHNANQRQSSAFLLQTKDRDQVQKHQAKEASENILYYLLLS